MEYGYEDFFKEAKQLEKNYTKLILPVVSITFKERLTKNIEELEKYFLDVKLDEEKQQKNIHTWRRELSYIKGNIEGLKTALNYC